MVMQFFEKPVIEPMSDTDIYSIYNRILWARSFLTKNMVLCFPTFNSIIVIVLIMGTGL